MFIKMRYLLSYTFKFAHFYHVGRLRVRMVKAHPITTRGLWFG